MKEIHHLIIASKNEKSYAKALAFLEEAHILSQLYAIPHFYVHWEIFLLAFKHNEFNEVFGQIPRLILAIPGSLLGLAPKGNLGSTKMGIFQKKKDD